MKPVLSFSEVLTSTSDVVAESCLERRFSLLRIDLKPLDDDAEVGDVGSVVADFSVGAEADVSFATAGVSETPVGAVPSSYKSLFPSIAVAVVGLSVEDVATTEVPRAGPVEVAARAASLDFRCSSLARRSSSALLAFSASLACLAAAFSSALRAFAARFSSSDHC